MGVEKVRVRTSQGEEAKAEEEAKEELGFEEGVQGKVVMGRGQGSGTELAQGRRQSLGAGSRRQGPIREVLEGGRGVGPGAVGRNQARRKAKEASRVAAKAARIACRSRRKAKS